jgi:hypothetical protein
VDADAQPEHPFTAQVVDAGLIREPDTSADAVTLLGRLCGTRGSLFTRQRHLEAPARTGVRQIVLCGDLSPHQRKPERAWLTSALCPALIS